MHVKAMIVGPPDTPYEFGFFEVRQPVVRRVHKLENFSS